jgi:hydroxylaminobenzene mutase
MQTTHTNTKSDRLILLGLILFLLGLIIGLAIPLLQNPRMGLSAHLEAITNGMLLMILGLIWHRIALSTKWLSINYWLLVYGTLANVTAVLLAAITGFGKLMPIAGGKEGSNPIESIISFLLVSLALAMLFVLTMVIIGYQNYLQTKKAAG